MKCCLKFLTVSFCLLLLNVFSAAKAIEADSGVDSEEYAKMTRDQYESEVMKLETWKANVQGTFMGDRLIGALTALDASIVRNARDTQSLYRRAYLYGTIGCTRAALVDLHKAIKSDLNSAPLYTERALCYMDMGEYLLAESDLNMAVYLNPLSGDAHFVRGRLYLILGKYELALADLLKCKDAAQEFSTVLPGELPANFYRAPDYYLGVAYELLGLPKQAHSCFLESSSQTSASENGYIHRYADKPLDSKERAEKLGSGDTERNLISF